LNRCLTQAVAYFKKEGAKQQQSRELEKDYQLQKHAYADIFLRGLMDGLITKENEIRNGFEYFGFTVENSFTVITIRVDHYRQVALALGEMEKHLLILKILKIVRAELANYKALSVMQSFNEVNVLLNGSHPQHEKIILSDKIKTAVYEQADTRVTVGIGRTYERASDIAVSRREADAAFRYRYRMGYNSVIPLEFVEPDNRITYLYPIERERRLVYSIVVGDYDYCRQTLKELFNALSGVKPLPGMFIANLVMTIVFNVSRYISEQNLPIANQVPRFFPTAEILRLTQPEAAYEFLDTSVKKFCAFVEEHNAKNSEKLHEATREYVREHYAESFSMAKVAAHLGTTPENLNKVFMEREQMMLFEFVMWVRVFEAQRLLTETDLDEEIIAGNIGFEDIKYFRSVFKKYNNQTPAEYRSANKA
jgi:AraC-like DNA-binding protein